MENYNVSGTIFGPKGTAVNTIDKNPEHHRADILVEKDT
jgi:hypothetical protein